MLHEIHSMAGREAETVPCAVVEMSATPTPAAHRTRMAKEANAFTGCEIRCASLAAAVARRRKGGRPSVMTAERLDAARTLRTNGQSYRQIGGALGVGASTVRENLGRAG